MKRFTIIILGALCGIMVSAFGAEAAGAPFGAAAAVALPNTDLRPSQTVLLYASELVGTRDAVVGSTISSAGFVAQYDNLLTGDETLSDSGGIGNIGACARVDLYFPSAALATGQMIVVCPGGGYQYVSTYNEGVYVADWMLARGIAVCVVKYRMPNGQGDEFGNPALEDVQNAFRYCRAHAAEWGIEQIGVMGFSAGGHLAVSASLLYDGPITRPDFSIFIYPVVSFDWAITHEGTRRGLIGSKDHLAEHYSLENQTSADNAPAFLVHCSDDGLVVPENSLRLYKSLIDNGVSAEMHIFPTGGHGWGFTPGNWFTPHRPLLDSALHTWLQLVR